MAPRCIPLPSAELDFISIFLIFQQFWWQIFYFRDCTWCQGWRMGGRWAVCVFPWGAPHACTPLCAGTPSPRGLGPFWSPPLGTGLSRAGCNHAPGLARAAGSCCTLWGNLGHPTTPVLAANCGGKSCLSPPHLPLASLDSPAQKLVFNRVNGKRPQVLPQQVLAPEECYTLAHEENVRFVYEGEGGGSLGAGTHSPSHP